MTKLLEFKQVEVDGIKFTRDKRTGYYLSSKNIKGKRKRLHVYVWEKNNGPVPKRYHVHHLDENKDNNSIENLQLLSASEHEYFHGKERSAMNKKWNAKFQREGLLIKTMRKGFVLFVVKLLKRINILKRKLVPRNAELNSLSYIGINKIEKVGHADVYNMEVENHHNFAVNGGFIVHNCMDADRYFAMKRLYKKKKKHVRLIKEGF